MPAPKLLIFLYIVKCINLEKEKYIPKRMCVACRQMLEKAMLYKVVLSDGERVLAVTLASRLSEDTFDVHFEKALPDVRGAYTAVNAELARHIRAKYPSVRYLDREEDMGLEGLRRAKESYHPHHKIEKCWACLLEDGYDY